jgi:hypothetical protein
VNVNIELQFPISKMYENFSVFFIHIPNNKGGGDQSDLSQLRNNDLGI